MAILNAPTAPVILANKFLDKQKQPSYNKSSKREISYRTTFYICLCNPGTESIFCVRIDDVSTNQEETRNEIPESA